MNESLKQFFDDFSKLQGKLPNPTKSKHVDFVSKRTGMRTKYSYADLAETRELIQPILAEFGFSVMQYFEPVDQNTFLITKLQHRSGESATSKMPLDLKGDMQEIGSRITYLRRYSLFSILGLVGEDDDDGTSADEFDKSKMDRKIEHKQEKKNPAQTDDRSPITAATLLSEGKSKGWTIEQMKEYILTRYNKSSSAAMHRDELEQMLSTVKTKDFMSALNEITL